MISVCMATYNGEKYIKEQVDSILHQLSEGDELVISDDGSNDATLDIITSYNDNRIKILKNDNRKGVVGNFENALNHAVGDYIFLSDQDDIWLDGKVAKCVAALQSADLVLHDAIVVDGQLNTIANSFFELRGVKKGYLNNLIKNSFSGSAMAFKRTIMNYILPMPNVAMHDIWIGLMVSRKGRVEFIYKPLLKFRRHSSNASHAAGKSNLNKCQQISYRIKMLCSTLTR